MKYALIAYLAIPIMIMSIVFIIYLNDPGLGTGLFIFAFPLICALMIVLGLMLLVFGWSSMKAQEFEDKAKLAAINDPVYNNLPPLGQVRVDIQRAKTQKYLGYGGFAIFSGILVLISPGFWIIPIVGFLRFVITYKKESDAAISEAESRRDSILNPPTTMGRETAILESSTPNGIRRHS